jgi:hypothetical protein
VRFLYDAVGMGMWAYSHASFRVLALGRRRFRLEPSTMIVVTHRRETDVPVIGPILYVGGRLWRNVTDRMAFAARDDMFVRGFFAGFPEGLSPSLRRLLYRVGVGPGLPLVHVHPIGSARLALVKQVLELQPAAPLEHSLSDELVGELHARAAAAGLPAPARASDVLRGEYADFLFRPVTRDEVGARRADELWARRAADAARDFRFLVELVRSGRSLVVFPEGRPSPDGEIGPLRRGVDALIRRAKPRSVLPMTIAYDPLVRGRTRVLVSVGEFFPPPAENIEQAILGLLRGSMPLTCGQVVASEMVAGRTPSAADLADAVARARETGRPVDPDLSDAGGRARRLDEALAVAEDKNDDLPFLAREYETARAAG